MINFGKQINLTTVKIILALLSILCISAISNAQVVAAGYGHTLTICADSTVMAFGSNITGQLGNGTTSSSNLPVPTSNLTSVIAVSAGDNFSMALKSDSTVWTWGNNGSGQLGNGTFTQSNVPVQVQGLTGVVSISAGGSHAIVAKADGTLWTWGNNNSGQAGNGTAGVNSNVPTIVTGSAGFVKVSAGVNHNLALKNDGTVWAMGTGTVGTLGTGNSASSFVLVQSNTLPGVTDIASGQNFCMALNADSTVSAWGLGTFGQIGNGSNTNQFSPVQVNSLTQITSLAQGSFAMHGIARRADGTIWVWGNNDNGQLGDGTLTNNNSPFQLSAPSDIVEVAIGNIHSVVIKSDGTTWAWGSNNFGQIGDGTNIDTNVPIVVSGNCTAATPCITTYGTANVTECDSYTWIDGNTYTASTNSPTYQTQNANGCDSIVTLKLTINNSSTSSIVASGVDSYVSPSGAIYTSPGNYVDTIQNAAGCDSIISIHLTLEHTGLNELENHPVSIYPNPTSGLLTLKGLDKLQGIRELQILSVTGTIVFEQNEPATTINASELEEGIYMIQIKHDRGIETIRFLKNQVSVFFE